MDGSETKNLRRHMPESGTRREELFAAASLGKESIDFPSIVASRLSSSPKSPCHRQLLGVPTLNIAEISSSIFLK